MRGIDEWANPLKYVIKTYEHRSLLRKLIRKLRTSFTNENVRKKLEVLVAFLSTQKIGGQLGLLSPPFFSKSFDQNYGKPLSQINKYANFALIIHLRRAKIKTWIN